MTVGHQGIAHITERQRRADVRQSLALGCAQAQECGLLAGLAGAQLLAALLYEVEELADADDTLCLCGRTQQQKASHDEPAKGFSHKLFH